MPSAPQLLATLKVFAETWNRELTDLLIDVYAKALNDLTNEQLIIATGRVMRECSFFPAPAEIRKRAGLVTQVAPNTTAIVRAIEVLGTYVAASGWHAPDVESVRHAYGDTIASAYGYVGPSRLFGTGTTRDIALRDFAESLSDALRANPQMLFVTADGIRELPAVTPQRKMLKAGKQ